MTPYGWAASTNPEAMLAFLRERALDDLDVAAGSIITLLRHNKR